MGLVACGPGYKELKVENIQSVTVATSDPDGRFCAYQTVPLRALVTYRDGKQAQSRIPGEKQRGRLRTSEFDWQSNRGAIDSAAVLSMPDDVLAWYDEPVEVRARVIARPELFGQASLRPRFDCGGTVDLRGAVGARGGEAEDGGPGQDGPELHLAVAYLDSQRDERLVLVRVDRADEQPEYFVIDGAGSRAPFVIDARGGDGGKGGQGVAGMDGAPGVDGQAGPDAPSCGDGAAGQDGSNGEPGAPGGPGAKGGPGGNGGRVHIQYDGRYPELAELVRVRVEGGEGGAHGPGGAGGSGGRGGAGGPGGKGNSLGTGGAVCSAGTDGPAGANGADGANGTAGPDGKPGAAGTAGEVEVSAADVAELFAQELGRGLRIVTGSSD